MTTFSDELDGGGLMEHDEMRRLTDDELYELRDIVACTAKTAPLYLEPERGNQVASILREVTELRAALAERDAKIREFVRRLPVEMFATTNAHYWGKDLQERAEGLENVKRLLRELGLTTED